MEKVGPENFTPIKGKKLRDISGGEIFLTYDKKSWKYNNIY